MLNLRAIHIGRQARALALALAIGAAMLAPASGHTAHAARLVTAEVEDLAIRGGGSETGQPETGPVAKPNGGSGKYCSYRETDGSVSLFPPGAILLMGGTSFKCGADGKWHEVRVGGGGSTVPRAPGGGVYTP